MWARSKARTRGSSMVLGFSTILEFFGLGEISGIDVFFAAMAVIGTVLFMIYFALMVVRYVLNKCSTKNNIY